MDNAELRLEYSKEWSRLRGEYRRVLDSLDSYATVFFRVHQRTKTISLDEGLEPELYRDRAEKITDFFSDLSFVFNTRDYRRLEEGDKIRHRLWYHRNPGQVAEIIKEDKGLPDPNQLDACIATYLKNDWLKDDWIDWALLDASIWHEYAGSFEHVASTYPGGWPKLHWVLSGSNPTKAHYIRKGFLLSGILLRYVIPISALFIFWKQRNFYSYDFDLFSTNGSVLEWSTRIYLLYLIIRLGTWPIRFRARRNIKKEEAPLVSGIETLGQIYEALAFPPISLENLRSYIYKARDESVIIRNSTYSLLDDLAARGTIVLAWDD